MLISKRNFRLEDLGAVDPLSPADMFGGDEGAHYRPRTTGEHGNLLLSRNLAEDTRVTCGFLERDVTGDCRDAEHVELFRRGESEKNIDGVILPGSQSRMTGILLMIRSFSLLQPPMLHSRGGS